jgi:hypothetical protein
MRGRGKAYLSTHAAALIVMSILAECCAGKVKRTVTDEWGAYAALSRYITVLNGGDYGKGALKCNDILGAVPLTSLNLESIPLKNLLRLRKKELGTGGGVYRNLRHGFLRKVEQHVQDITTNNYTQGQLREIRRQFKEELRSDYEDLALELGVPAKEAFGSKEMAAVVAISAAAASILPVLVGGAVKLAGLVGAGAKYRSARRRILRGHSTSYVYLAEKGRFEWDLR